MKGNSIETFVWISIEVFSIPLFFSDNNELKKIEPAQTSVMLEGENFFGAGSKWWAESAPLGWNRVNGSANIGWGGIGPP